MHTNAITSAYRSLQAMAIVTERLNAAKPPSEKNGKGASIAVNNNKDLDVDAKKEEPSFFGSFFSSAKNAPKKKGAAVVPGLQEHQALLCVSHSRQEVPGCVREWVCLAEQGMGQPRFGRWDGPLELAGRRWNEIWKR